MITKQSERISELIKLHPGLPLFIKKTGLETDDIIEADTKFHTRIKFSKDRSKAENMIGILINYTDTIYMFCPTSRRVFYSDLKDITIDRRSSFHINEFIKRFKAKKLV